MSDAALPLGTSGRALGAAAAARRLVTVEAALVGAIVAVFAARVVVAVLHARPVLFPDEPIYIQTARALAGGEVPPTPAVLSAALSAPLWLLSEDAGLLGMRLLNLAGAAAGVGCAYAVARELGYSERQRRWAALLVALTPGLVYGGSFLTEGLAFGAVVAWAWAMLRWVERRGREWPVAALALAASLARPQYILLFAVGIGAALLQRRRPREVPLHFVGLYLGFSIAGVALANSVYRGAIGRIVGGFELEHAAETTGLLTAVTLLGIGVAVPLAAAALADRPDLRRYGAIVGATTGAMVLVSAVFLTGVLSTTVHSGQVIERYTFTAAALALVLVPAATRLHPLGAAATAASLLALPPVIGILEHGSQSPLVAAGNEIGVEGLVLVSGLALAAARRWPLQTAAAQLALVAGLALMLDLAFSRRLLWVELPSSLPAAF